MFDEASAWWAYEYPELSHCKGTAFMPYLQIYNVNFCKFIIFILLFKISHFKAF